jgi:hypothetical protein
MHLRHRSGSCSMATGGGLVCSPRPSPGLRNRRRRRLARKSKRRCPWRSNCRRCRKHRASCRPGAGQSCPRTSSWRGGNSRASLQRQRWGDPRVRLIRPLVVCNTPRRGRWSVRVGQTYRWGRPRLPLRTRGPPVECNTPRGSHGRVAVVSRLCPQVRGGPARRPVKLPSCKKHCGGQFWNSAAGTKWRWMLAPMCKLAGHLRRRPGHLDKFIL